MFDITGRYEPNPFQLTPPSGLESLKDHFENVLEQHNLTQAGDTTFSWEIATQQSKTKLYTLGSKSRFFHPEFGVILATYVEFSVVNETLVGMPVSVDSRWKAIDSWSNSNPWQVLGLVASSTPPRNGQFGWVITHGPNINPITIRLTQPATNRMTLGWWASGILSHKEVTAQIALVDDASGLVPLGGLLWLAPAGSIMMQRDGVHKSYVTTLALEATAGLEVRLTLAESSISALQDSLISGGFAASIQELEISLDSIISALNQEATNRQAADRSLSDRLAVVESVNLSGYATSLEFNQLELDYSQFVISAEARLAQVESSSGQLLSSIQALQLAHTANANQIAGLSQSIAEIVAKPVPVSPALLSPWVNAGTPEQDVEYAKASDKLISITGAVSAPALTPVLSVLLFTLPVNHRPIATLNFVCWSGAGPYHVKIESSGDVTLLNCSTVLSCLDGISFYAA